MISFPAISTKRFFACFAIPTFGAVATLAVEIVVAHAANDYIVLIPHVFAPWTNEDIDDDFRHLILHPPDTASAPPATIDSKHKER
jgi:hypothetical protein